MSAYFIRPPFLYRWLFADAIFRGSSKSKTVYLTFDDGPHSEATPWVLNVLKSHGVRATFFVLGKNVEKHPELLSRIKEEGHLITNHGMNHLDGWRANTSAYLADVADGKARSGSDIFRPAYGKLGWRQYQKLKKTENIVFWDVISGDFDESINGDKVVRNVVDNTRNGSIIVMHDSQRAFSNLKSSLDQVIHRLSEKGYSFGTIDTLLANKNV